MVSEEARSELISITTRPFPLVWIVHPASPPTPQGIPTPVPSQKAEALLGCQLLEDRCQVWPFASSTSPGCSLSCPPAAPESVVWPSRWPCPGEGNQGLWLYPPAQARPPLPHPIYRGLPRGGGGGRGGGRRGEGAEDEVEGKML